MNGVILSFFIPFYFPPRRLLLFAPSTIRRQRSGEGGNIALARVIARLLLTHLVWVLASILAAALYRQKKKRRLARDYYGDRSEIALESYWTEGWSRYRERRSSADRDAVASLIAMLALLHSVDTCVFRVSRLR